MDNLNLTGTLGATIKAYNGKPVLLRKGVKVTRHGEGTPELTCEFTVNVHQFNYLSRRALYSLQSRVKDMLVNFAVLIEGQEEDELPECVLGTCVLRNLNPEAATPDAS